MPGKPPGVPVKPLDMLAKPPGMPGKPPGVPAKSPWALAKVVLALEKLPWALEKISGAKTDKVLRTSGGLYPRGLWRYRRRGGCPLTGFYPAAGAPGCPAVRLPGGAILTKARLLGINKAHAEY
jgi:hypothetical protein